MIITFIKVGFIAELFCNTAFYSVFVCVCIISSQHVSVMATAGVWTAVCASAVGTWQRGHTARAACPVTMAIPPMEGDAMVSAKVTRESFPYVHFWFEHQQTMSVYCRTPYISLLSVLSLNSNFCSQCSNLNLICCFFIFLGGISPF